MIVEFDVQVHWTNTLADMYEASVDRTYSAAPLPDLLILVLREEITLSEIGYDTFRLMSRPGKPPAKYDCLVGWHEADAPAGYTHAIATGYKHSKLTVLRPAPADAVSEIKLSEILAGAPQLDLNQTRYVGKLHDLPVMLPPALIKELRQLAPKHFGESMFAFNALVITALHEYLENNN